MTVGRIQRARIHIPPIIIGRNIGSISIIWIRPIVELGGEKGKIWD